MEIYLKLFEVLFPVFFIVGIGYYLGKKNPNFDNSFITSFASNVGTPAMVIYAITSTGISFDIYASYFIYYLIAIIGFTLTGIIILYLLKTKKTMKKNSQQIIDFAKNILSIEAEEIINAKENIDEKFVDLVKLIFSCKGRVILSGMGKSGHIARKIASTFSSTGTAAFFMHPGEASHGDLGMILKEDVVIFFSNSGKSDELLAIIPNIKRIGASIVAITSNEKSEIAKYADHHISSKVSAEACPLGLAPTASSALMLAIGDAIAVSLFQLKGFTAEDFLKSHPGGALGKNKFIKIKEVMRSINEVPVVNPGDSLKQTIKLITEKKVGYAVVADKLKYLGIFTDGDLRRSILKEASISDEISKWMSTNPFFINEHNLATSAAELMEKNKISSLVVVDNRDDLVGVINFQDLLINKVI